MCTRGSKVQQVHEGRIPTIGAQAKLVQKSLTNQMHLERVS